MAPLPDRALGWLRDNAGNIYAGIIASWIVLALQIVSRATTLIVLQFVHVRWRLQLLWSFRRPTKVYVVSGAIKGVSDEIKGVVLAGPDAEAANALVATVGLLYPAAEVRHVYSSSFPPELYKEHLVLVGGPMNNSCSAAVLRALKSLAYDDDFQMVLDGKCFKTDYEGDAAVKDHGAIVRVDNPFDLSKDVIIASGCDTYGVLAASLAISARAETADARRALHRSLGFRKYFSRVAYEAVFQCDVLGNDVANISLVHFRRVTRAK
jgi:hypothetical protein